MQTGGIQRGYGGPPPPAERPERHGNDRSRGVSITHYAVSIAVVSLTHYDVSIAVVSLTHYVPETAVVSITHYVPETAAAL